jgi:hypothetical protein
MRTEIMCRQITQEYTTEVLYTNGHIVYFYTEGNMDNIRK